MIGLAMDTMEMKILKCIKLKTLALYKKKENTMKINLKLELEND
jgi:hypothetical protein